MAKDVALFSTVLKDLGSVLEAGQKTTLYRKEAYDSSAAIVKECKVIFDELQDVIPKASRGSMVPSNSQPSLDSKSKVMLVFKKPKVQMMRGNLESLKSTITVQLAVLNYASRLKDATARYIIRTMNDTLHSFVLT